MMPQPGRGRTAARKKVGNLKRPPIESTAVYSYRDASLFTGAAEITLRRAVDAGFLRVRRIGRKTLFLGSDLLEWIASGGRTGRSAIDLQREREAAVA